MPEVRFILEAGQWATNTPFFRISSTSSSVDQTQCAITVLTSVSISSWDKYSPFPEEMNRTLVGDIAELHFSPTTANADNLRREAIAGEIFITGNTVIDAMDYTVRDDYVFNNALLNDLDFAGKRVIVVTCHRRENYGKPMEEIMTAIAKVVELHPDVEVVYPVHLSPVSSTIAPNRL